MKDIINSFKAHLYERTSSPLIGAFIFYWIICNYKLIMIIFDDDMKLNEKFDLIKTIYPQEKITLWNGFDIYYQILLGNGLLIPLIITLIYILLLPYASNYIHSLWIKHQNNLKRISNEKVLTKKEFGDLQRRFTELELSFDDTFSKKDNEISQLKALLNNKELLIIEYENEIDNIKKNKIDITIYNELKESYEKLLSKDNYSDYIAKDIKDIQKILISISDKDSYNLDNLANDFKLHKLKAEEILKYLFEANYIEKDNKYGVNNHSFVKITDYGKEYLLKQKLV